MANGKDERFNTNRKVTREALGNRYAEIGVGFGDDPRVIKAIAEEKEMRGGVDISKIASSVTEEDENIHPYLDDEQLVNPELRYEPDDDIGPYDGQDYEDDERYERNKDEPGALLPSQQTGNRY